MNHVFEHDGQRFLIAVFTFPQTLNRFAVCSIRSKVKSSYAFDGNYPAFYQELHGPCQDFRPLEFISPGIQKNKSRAARRAGIGFRMESPVERVFIFGAAVRTEGKAGHGGMGSVIGDIVYDSKTRAAVCAIDEGVEVASVGRIKQLTKAFAAYCRIGGDVCISAARCAAGYYLKGKIAFRRNGRSAYPGDCRQGWKIAFDVVQAVCDYSRSSFKLDDNTLRCILNKTGQTVFARQSVDKRAKTNSLDRSRDMIPHPSYCNRISRRNGGMIAIIVRGAVHFFL
jgi:hypothetical protein